MWEAKKGLIDWVRDLYKANVWHEFGLSDGRRLNLVNLISNPVAGKLVIALECGVSDVHAEINSVIRPGSSMSMCEEEAMRYIDIGGME